MTWQNLLLLGDVSLFSLKTFNIESSFQPGRSGSQDPLVPSGLDCIKYLGGGAGEMARSSGPL